MTRGFVYFLQEEGAPDRPIKIGWSRSPVSRAHDLNTGYPFGTLGVIWMFQGSVRDERALHSQFAPVRLRGEWFRADPSVFAFILDFSQPARPLGDTVHDCLRGIVAAALKNGHHVPGWFLAKFGTAA